MAAFFSGMKAKIAEKYQGVASPQVINAVHKASKKTGVDFAFLMEKASTESSFNPTAKSKTSSATGLFQFIENTWLSMVKKHGEKFGLSEYADKIEMKNGRCSVDSAAARREILGLRNNPEIAALMAGCYSAENRDYLDAHTKGEVGTTEMYLAHFMGAGGAAKFLNCRDYDGNAIGARLFPEQARANKNVFYNKATGKARTLDQIYALFDKKFSDGPSVAGGDAPSPASRVSLTKGSIRAFAAAHHSSSPSSKAAQVLPLFDDGNDKDDIIWSNDPRFHHNTRTGSNTGRRAVHRITPETIMVMQQMRDVEQRAFFRAPKDKYGYNS
ncbi:MAG TPA: transglycosylase SLT domain-containing protein [Patescibacteria group bacterium]|nr:transglycosylase SLT domain-containing protein [Patescibacteria group bacterium]